MGLDFCIQHPEMVISFGVWILWATMMIVTIKKHIPHKMPAMCGYKCIYKALL